MAVDVVVVSYKTPYLREDFIRSYNEYRFPGCVLISVDVDDVPDHDVISRRGVGDDRRIRIQLSENVGYARACNDGAQMGSNDVILLANADTLLSDGFEECYNALVDNKDWGILGPRQVDERNCITAGGIFGTETNIGQRGWQELDHGQYSDVREDAKSVSGSLYFIKRSVWEELTRCEHMQADYPGIRGAFIPTPHYYEETCCSYHARAHGYKIVYYGLVQMTHLWHKASVHGGWADQQVETSKAMMRDFCKHHGIQCE